MVTFTVPCRDPVEPGSPRIWRREYFVRAFVALRVLHLGEPAYPCGFIPDQLAELLLVRVTSLEKTLLSLFHVLVIVLMISFAAVFKQH